MMFNPIELKELNLDIHNNDSMVVVSGGGTCMRFVVVVSGGGTCMRFVVVVCSGLTCVPEGAVEEMTEQLDSYLP